MRRTYGAATADGPDDFALALDLCDRAEDLADDDAVVLAIVALERHNLRDDGTTGLALAERALALNPHSYTVLDLVATIHMQRDRPDRAIELFRCCLWLSPNAPTDAVAFDAIAACHLSAGRFAEALEWESRALNRKAKWDMALVTLTVTLALSGHADEARSALERFLAVRPGATIRGLMDRLPPGTRRSVEPLWPEGLRRAGLAEG